MFRSASGGRVPDAERVNVALCLNIGSSSLKFALFRVTASDEACLANGLVEQLGTPSARAHLTVGASSVERACADASVSEALGVAFRLLEEQSLPKATVVGHRVVHGGREHLSPTSIDRPLLESLKALIPLAPLHLPAAISGMEAALEHWPDLPQVACFDTSFHARMPECAARFPLPAQLFEQGVRRYGFHGLSYEYILSTLGAPPPHRVIVAHLGNGASLAAIQDGQSIDTTMGFTPGGGIMMGTRTGDLDPGLLLYLLREKGYSVDSLEHLLERESGLLGVAGSSDMRQLIERAEHDEHANLAIEMMGYQIRKTIGAYIAALGGIDVLVFTGGIGEHTPAIRRAACRGLSAFGITLDDSKNDGNAPAIHAEASVSRILVVQTDEDRMIARHAGAIVRELR
jgi:acetate kinase